MGDSESRPNKRPRDDEFSEPEFPSVADGNHENHVFAAHGDDGLPQPAAMAPMSAAAAGALQQRIDTQLAAMGWQLVKLAGVCDQLQEGIGKLDVGCVSIGACGHRIVHDEQRDGFGDAADAASGDRDHASEWHV